MPANIVEIGGGERLTQRQHAIGHHYRPRLTDSAENIDILVLVIGNINGIPPLKPDILVQISYNFV